MDDLLFPRPLRLNFKHISKIGNYLGLVYSFLYSTMIKKLR